jgi:hypothetical protein
MNHSGRIVAPVGVSTEAGEDHSSLRSDRVHVTRNVCSSPAGTSAQVERNPHLAVDPHSSVALVGCSGSIAGIVAILGVLRPKSLGFVVMNVYWAWTGTAGGISFAAHLGGFSFGAVVGLLARAQGARWVIV